VGPKSVILDVFMTKAVGTKVKSPNNLQTL